MWLPRKVVKMDYVIIFLLLFPCYYVAQAQVTETVCQYDWDELKCGDDRITISNAVYGRTEPNGCVTSGRTDCELDVTDRVADRCDSQMQCWVQASNNFGNPCPGFLKYLVITYTCGSNVGRIINLEEESSYSAIITYPSVGTYYNDRDILWRVVSPMGSAIRLDFTRFGTESCCDFLTIYDGWTQFFDEAAKRVRFSGSTVPLRVISMNSLMWIHFTSNGENRYQGFSALANIVAIPDWMCDFYTDNCRLSMIPGSWTVGNLHNYYYTEAHWDSGDIANFTVPYNFTSSDGTLSFAYYQPNGGNLSVAVCISQQRISYGTTGHYIEYRSIQYSCQGINDVEITFTAFRTYSNTQIRVYDIQLYEVAAPSTASIIPATTSTQFAVTTQPASSMQPITSKQSSTSRQPVTTPQSSTSKKPLTSSISLSSPGTLSSAVIPAVSSVIVLLVIGLIIGAVFVYLRRRSREPKPVGPVDQDDDDPSLYNNPVYVSKEDDFSTPDLLVGINLRNGSSVSPAPNGSPDLDNQYEDFDGDQKNTVKGCPLPTNSSSSRAGPLHSSPKAPDVDLVNTNMYHILERPESEVIYKEGDHTYEQAQGPAQSSRNPNEKANGHKGTDDVYENSSFASPVDGLPQGHVNDGGENGSSDVIAVLDDDEEYNALTFNQSSDITRALKKPKMAADHVNDGYGALDLPQDKAASLSTNSAELHNDDVYNSLDESLVGQQNEKPSTTGERSNGKGDVDLQQGAESDYHNYQDPTQMDREGSGPRSADLDVFSNDQYNILDSGKQVGDYHVYQSTDDKDGGYTEFDTSKMNGEDEYSTIDLDQSHQSKATGKDSFEPIYSDEIYSEFN